MSPVHLMDVNEMKGFISNLPSHYCAQARRRAAVIHYFTKRLYGLEPYEVGDRIAANLNAFLTLVEGRYDR